MTEEEIRQMTGQDKYGSTPRLVLNEVLINGDADIEEMDGKIVHKGGYFRKRIWVGKPEDAKPEDVNLGKEISLVFLKIRRKLVQRSNDGQIVKSTGEHDTVDDIVSVFEDSKKIFSGTARDAREEHDGLRTVQIVYALLLSSTEEPELVRLTIKGASLGSDARPKELPSFYQYIGSFGKDSITSFVTKLGVFLEQGKKKYYTITFTKGNPVSDDRKPLVLEKLKEVFEHTKSVVKLDTDIVKDVPEGLTEEDFGAIPF